MLLKCVSSIFGSSIYKDRAIAATYFAPTSNRRLMCICGYCIIQENSKPSSRWRRSSNVLLLRLPIHFYHPLPPIAILSITSCASILHKPITLHPQLFNPGSRDAI